MVKTRDGNKLPLDYYRTLERETYEECYISKFFLLKNFVDGRRKSPGCLAAVQKCIQLCRENKMPFTFIRVNTAQPNSIWRIGPLARTTARIHIIRPEHNINLPRTRREPETQRVSPPAAKLWPLFGFSDFVGPPERIVNYCIRSAHVGRATDRLYF